MVTYTLFMEQLARGPLKNTSAVEVTNLGEICPDYVDTVLNLTNQGLADITTRLPILRKLVDLTFVDDQFLYPLVVEGGYLSTTDDDLTTFVNQAFVKVLDIYDADGKRYQPNTGGHITTPTFNSIRFSAAVMDSDDSLYIGPKIRIQYQAKHLVIAEDDVIDLPPNLMAALQYFVASQFISDMGSKEHMVRGDNYFAMYLRHVTEDEIRNTSGTSQTEEDPRFYETGFV